MKNIEIKAKISKQQYSEIEKKLKQLKADFKGIDYQIDIYFNTKNGLLKLRKGNIEKYLIYYERPEISGPKKSDVILFENIDENLENILKKALNIKGIVKKERKIFFIGNKKIHLDFLENYGYFFEIEVQDTSGTADENLMRKECFDFMEILGIKNEQLLNKGYLKLLNGKK